VHRACEIAARLELATYRSRQDLGQSFLVNRRTAGIDGLELRRIDVDTSDVMTVIGEARTADEPDVAGSHDRDAHQAASAVRLCEYQTSER
jgi:hypothetical protein